MIYISLRASDLFDIISGILFLKSKVIKFLKARFYIFLTFMIQWQFDVNILVFAVQELF